MRPADRLGRLEVGVARHKIVVLYPSTGSSCQPRPLRCVCVCFVLCCVVLCCGLGGAAGGLPAAARLLAVWIRLCSSACSETISSFSQSRTSVATWSLRLRPVWSLPTPSPGVILR